MEIADVRISLTLYEKMSLSEKGYQIELSVLVTALREFSVDAVMGGYKCAVETSKISAANTIEELAFWVKLRGNYEHFFLREIVEGVFILSDR